MEESIRDRIRGLILEFLDSLEWRKKRRDSRRLYPLLTIALFIAVTITHEATYASSFEQAGFRFIGWPYAIAINISILVTEFFLQWKTTRRWAWIGFGISTIGSGMMNVAYVQPWLRADAFFAWVYALLPTAIIVVLGFLSSGAGSLASRQEARWEKEDEAPRYDCFCGESFSKPIQLANHTKKHASEVRAMEGVSAMGAIEKLRKLYPNGKDYPSIPKILEWRGE